MRPTTSVITLLAATALLSAPAVAQQTVATNATVKHDSTSSAPATKDSATAKKDSAAEAAAAKKASMMPIIEIQNIRPNDQRGINVFEAPKELNKPFTGFKVGFGASFTQQFQALNHGNTAVYKAGKDANGNTVNLNQLINIGNGANNAVANAYLNGQLAKGIRVAMTSYLSARHHNETWVKDGYLQIDDSPIDFQPLNTLMQYLTVKAGHFELNYGDAHFRRTDNGNAMFNPLVGNYIMDAFTTEVGGEAIVRAKGLMVMGAATNGEVRGTVLNSAKRAPLFLGKVGADEQLSNDLRVRLTGSWLGQARSNNQTLYSGDRAGSRYYDVLENTISTESNQAWSGAIQPFSGPSAGLHAAVINPFIKYRGLEYFGNFERATGRSLINNAPETTNRQVDQIVNELTFRFLGDQLYLSGRYNTVDGQMIAGSSLKTKVDRSQFGGGWFITPVVLMKAEYVNQKYHDFPSTDIRNGGKFNGWMAEGVVSF